MRVGMADMCLRWDELREEEPGGKRAPKVDSPSTVHQGLAGDAPAEVTTFKMKGAPDLTRARSSIDAEALFHMGKTASDVSMRSQREQIETLGKKRTDNASEQVKKSFEALDKAIETSTWGWLSKAFTWIAVAASVVAAVATCGAGSIIAAACICAHMALSETGLYSKMGVAGEVVAGLLSVGAAANNWVQMALAAVDQLVDKLGGYAEMEMAGAIALRSSINLASLGVGIAGVGNLAGTPGEFAKKLTVATDITKGATQIAGGATQIVGAFERYDAAKIEIDIQRLRNIGSRIRHQMTDLLDLATDESKRKARYLEGATSAEEKRSSTAVTIASALRA